MNNTYQAICKAHADSPIRVTQDRSRAAFALLDMLDHAKIPEPRLVVAIDGELALLWEDATKCLVLVPEPSGHLRFVVEFGRERREGRKPYALAIPREVQEILDVFKPTLH